MRLVGPSLVWIMFSSSSLPIIPLTVSSRARQSLALRTFLSISHLS